MLKLYVSCALTEAPPEFRRDIEELKEVLSKDYEVLKFLGLGVGDPGDVWQRDIIDNVDTCHLMLAVCDYPSIGLGMEILEAGKIRSVPVLAVSTAGKNLTRMVAGMSKFHPNLKIGVYNNLLEDVPKLLAKFTDAAAEDMWDIHAAVPIWSLGAEGRSRQE